MKTNIVLFLITISFSLNAQVSSEIKYLRKIHVDGSTFNSGFELNIDNEQQLSDFVFKGILNQSDTITNIIDDLTTHKIIIQKNDNPKPFTNQKNFKNHQLISYEFIYGEKDTYLIKEDLPELNWEITPETKNILGYQTQKAITKFRGREYEAWFAQEINIQDGPWKFHGLPGLILDVKSQDGFVEFIAYELTLNHAHSPIENLIIKYKELVPISFSQKKEIESKNISKQVKFLQSQNPEQTEVTITTNDLEILE